MKVHSNIFKENIKTMGREIESKITYELNGETIELGSNDLNSITPSYEGNILKSVMKQLEIDSNVDIPVGTIINYQFGLKVDEQVHSGDITNIYEWLDFGNYVVKESEKQEDLRSYKIICYDKMLYSMKPYERLNEYSLTEDTDFVEGKEYYVKEDDEYSAYDGERTGDPSLLGLYEYNDAIYPLTIREYINKLCNHLDIVFANNEDEFANYDKVIEGELFLSSDGSSLEYTFRDVFDQLAEATASTICINKDDELEIRYINETNDTIDGEFLKNINVNFGEKYGPVNSIVLSRAAESDNIYLRDEESVELNGLCEIKIKENQIMNFNDRYDYLPAILEKLDGLEYYVNDFSSTGITYYDLCDAYNIEITEIDYETEEETTRTYRCIMLNDEINITQGLEESVHTELFEKGETDYSKADTTDRRINRAYLIVDKQNQTIEGLLSRQEENIEKIERLEATVEGLTNTLSTVGGTNMIKDSMGILNDGSWLDENDDKAQMQSINYPNSVGQSAIVVNDTLFKQEIKCKNGTYTLSFNYEKLTEFGNLTLTINGVEHTISHQDMEESTTQFLNTFEVTTNVINISFVGDLANTGYIYDLMLNEGVDRKEWEQNQDETTTDTVKIGRGVEVSSTSQNTISRMDADGFRIISNQNNQEVLYATDKGIVTRELTSTSDSNINGLMFIRTGNQVWITGVDG